MNKKDYFFKLFKRLQILFADLYHNYKTRGKTDGYYITLGQISELTIILRDLDYCRFSAAYAFPGFDGGLELVDAWHLFCDNLWIDYKLEYRDFDEWENCYCSDC